MSIYFLAEMEHKNHWEPRGASKLRKQESLILILTTCVTTTAEKCIIELKLVRIQMIIKMLIIFLQFYDRLRHFQYILNT